MASNHTRPRKKGGALKILLVLLVLVLAAAGGAFLLAKREIDGGTPVSLPTYIRAGNSC